MAEDLVKAIADLREEEALRITESRLDSGDEPMEILEDGNRAMEIVGKRFSREEYFIPELVYSGEILKRITRIVKPRLRSTAESKKSLGKFLIGTVAGDIHDIGKDIVTFMLDVNGFDVYDLGVNVPAKDFVARMTEVQPDIVGLSGLLTQAFSSMKETIDAIRTSGLRDRAKIVIGGPQVDEQVMNYTGADAFCRDAMCGVSLAREWTGGR